MMILSIFAVLYLGLFAFANLCAYGGSKKWGWFAVVLAVLIASCTASSQPVRYNGAERLVPKSDSITVYKELAMRSNKITDIGQLKFGGTSATILKAIDFANRNSGDASTFWLWMDSYNAWGEDGTLNAKRSVFRPTSSTPGVNIYPYGTSAGNTSALALYELVANGVNYTGFKAPDVLSGNVVYTLPTADGTVGTVLSTNGSGVLSWAAGGAGTNVIGFRTMLDDSTFDHYRDSTLSFDSNFTAKTWGNFKIRVGFNQPFTVNSTPTLKRLTTTSGAILADNSFSNNVSIGSSASVANGATVVGTSGSGGTNSVVIGYQGTGSASGAVSVGHSTTNSGQSAVSIGQLTTASSGFTLAGGYGASATGQKATAWGAYSSAGYDSSSAFGHNATSDAKYHIMLGTAKDTTVFPGGWVIAGTSRVNLQPLNVAEGSSNQVLGMNGSGTSREWKSITGGGNISITHTIGGIAITDTGGGSFGGFANPTGTIGLTAVNGVLTTGMRSDGAPALSQAIVPTWSGIHTFSNRVDLKNASHGFDNRTLADTSAGEDTTMFSVQYKALKWALYQGTFASPLTVAGPTFKIVRKQNIDSTAASNKADIGANSALYVYNEGTINNYGQPIAITGVSQMYSNRSYTTGNDAAGVAGYGRVMNGATGIGLGGFFDGRRDWNGGKANALQLAVSDWSTRGTTTYSSTGFDSASALWFSNHGTSGNVISSYIKIGNGDGIAAQVGIGFAAQNGSPVTQSDFRTDDTSMIALDIRGSHRTGALVIASGAGYVGIGTSTPSVALDVVGYENISGTTTVDSLIGGTSSGGNLVLTSTSHATKGAIIFGNSRYDEANNRMGIGTSSPTQAPLVIGGTQALNQMFYINATNAGTSTSQLQGIYNNPSISPGGASLASSYGILNTPTLTSTNYTITNAVGVNSNFNTSAGFSGTLSNLKAFEATSLSISGGSVTNYYGYYANNVANGGTFNGAFYGNMTSGTGKWNIYMAGSAANYMLGNTSIGGTTTTSLLNVGTTAQTQIGATGMSALNSISLQGPFGVPGIVDTIQVTNLTADYAAANITGTAVNGVYRISVYLYPTTAGTSGTVNATIRWNDGAAESAATGTHTFGALGTPVFISGQICTVTNSTAITYEVDFTSPVGSPVCTINVVAERLF